MSLTKEDIVARRDTFISDAQEVQKRVLELTKATEQNKNLLQALNGALQQCTEFLKSFEDEDGDAGNGKKKPD